MQPFQLSLSTELKLKILASLKSHIVEFAKQQNGFQIEHDNKITTWFLIEKMMRVLIAFDKLYSFKPGK